MNYRIFPPEELPECSISLPLSKSMSARALIINALQQRTTTAKVASCDDTKAMSDALAVNSGTVNINAAGTAMRFLTAYYAVTEGSDIILDGTERMRHRPIGPLVDALRQCGACIEYTGEEGFPPLHIHGRKLDGGKVSIDASVSSQFISALLMTAPYMTLGLDLTLEGELASLPYADMTLSMMREAGAEAERNGANIIVKPVRYSLPVTQVEADWSAASYWYEIEALTSGFITLEGVAAHSTQGDSIVAKIYEQLGVVTEFHEEDAELLASPDLSPRLQLDLGECPDLVPAIVVTCVMLRIPFRFTGLESLRIKECDRIDALCTELLRAGAIITEEAPGIISWDTVMRPIQSIPVFDTYDDHRMAMALAPIAAYCPGIIINNAEVVTKSYPEYWNDLRVAGFIVQDESEPIPEQFDIQQ